MAEALSTRFAGSRSPLIMNSTTVARSGPKVPVTRTATLPSPRSELGGLQGFF
jgi:hypothetical protein